ncbi:hypothetical protein ACOSQ2_003220 [Xanthoceras sorbifolium]
MPSSHRKRSGCESPSAAANDPREGNSPFVEPLNAAINSHRKGHLFSIYFFLSCPSLDRSYQALPVIEAQKRAGGNPHLKMNLFLFCPSGFPQLQIHLPSPFTLLPESRNLGRDMRPPLLVSIGIPIVQ